MCISEKEGGMIRGKSGLAYDISLLWWNERHLKRGGRGSRCVLVGGVKG